MEIATALIIIGVGLTLFAFGSYIFWMATNPKAMTTEDWKFLYRQVYRN